MVLLIVVVVVGALTPAVLRALSHARVNRAARVVAADFMLAQTLAGRQRRPVIMTWDSTARTMTIAQPAPSSTVLLTRNMGTSSDFKLAQLSATSGSVRVLPTGSASGAVTVTVGDGSYSRQVRMTRAGLVRVL